MTMMVTVKASTGTASSCSPAPSFSSETNVGGGKALGVACSKFSLKKKVENCNSDVKCPIDCKMSAWSGWGGCSAQCGGGVKLRTRHVLREGSDGGKLCGGSSQEVATCNVASCDRDCVLGR